MLQDQQYGGIGEREVIDLIDFFYAPQEFKEKMLEHAKYGAWVYEDFAGDMN